MSFAFDRGERSGAGMMRLGCLAILWFSGLVLGAVSYRSIALEPGTGRIGRAMTDHLFTYERPDGAAPWFEVPLRAGFMSTHVAHPTLRDLFNIQALNGFGDHIEVPLQLRMPLGTMIYSVWFGCLLHVLAILKIAAHSFVAQRRSDDGDGDERKGAASN
jgi:hypothetical protein